MLLLAACALPGRAEPPETWSWGPIPGCSPSQLSLPFLSFAAECDRLLESGELFAEIQLGVTNTFIDASEVTRTRTDGRVPLTRTEFQDLISTRPDEDLYVLDLEATRVWAVVRYGLSERVELSVEIPYVSLGGGFLDATAESFHDLIGVGQGGRDRYPRDQLLVALYLDGHSLFISDAEAGSGFGEPVFSTKWRVHREDDIWPNIVLQGALKLPLGGDRLGATGGWDGGVNLIMGKRWAPRAVFLNAGYVFAGSWWAIPDLPIADTYHLVVGIERRLGARFSFGAQTLMRRSFFAEATDTDLSNPSYEATLGLKWQASNLRGSFSLTENYASLNSSADFGINLSLAASFP